MSDALKIQVIVDAAQVTAGMAGVTTTIEAATARVKAAFGSVKDAPAGIQNALKVLENQSRMTAETVAFATEAINELGQVSSGAAQQVNKLSDAERKAAAEARMMDRQMAMASARIGATAGGVGGLGYALGRVGAYSSTLAPILSAAFPILAVGAFADILVTATDRLTKLISETYIFSKAEQDLYKQQVKVNAEILKMDEQHIKSLREIQLIGLSTVDQAKLRAQWATEDHATLTQQVALQTKQLQVETDKLKSLEEQRAVQESLRDLAPEHGGAAFEDLGQKISDQRVKIDGLNASLGDLQVKMRGAGDAADIAGKHFKVDQLKENEKEVEHARESLERYTAAMQRLNAEQDRLKRSQQQLTEQQKEFGARQDNSQAIEESRALIERNDAERQFQQDRIADEKQAALAEIELEQDKVKELSRLGKISADQEAQRLNALEDQKLVIEKTYLQKRINEILARLKSDDAKTYQEDLKEWSKLLTDKQKAEDEHNKKRQQNAANAAVAEQKTWEKMTQGINRMMDMAVQGIVTGTETLGKAFGNIVDGMLAKFIEAMLQMLEQWIMTHVLMVAVKKDAQQKEVLSDAKAAAAAAWKAVVGIPIIGPVLAPVAAATAFAGVEAFSAAGGMDFVPADNTLALLHKREMVLPGSISDSIRQMTSFAAQGSAGAPAGAGNGGRDVHVHYSPTVHAVDKNGVEDFFRKNETALVRTIHRAVRKGNVL